ncbi:MAG TPA: YeeE/YedE family protein [Candidatus Tectomicrobia bacterium]|nr:YeeE/YedE family protein [Candidatus Tectomicrobia bacterium]
MNSSDIARIAMQSSAASRARSLHILLGVAAAAAALAILVTMASSDRLLAVFWLFGLAFGFVLQRSRFCFASAFRDLFLLGDARVMKAIIAGLAVATAGFGVLMARLLPDVGHGSLPLGATVLPLGIHTLLGGVLFGVGMVLAGGCTSGSLYRAGEGYVGSMVSLFGIMLGLEFSSHTWNWWWEAHISRAPLIWLPEQLGGYLGGISVTFGVLLFLYLAISWWEFRRSILLPAQRGDDHMASSFSEQLRTLGQTIFVKGWPVVLGGVALATLNVFLYTYRHPWGVVAGLGIWADKLASALDLGAGELLGRSSLAGCAFEPDTASALGHMPLLNLGVIAGAFIAASLASEFKLRVPKQPLRYVQSAGGGVLMGYGAGLALGCTVGAFFSAIPSLALNGWAFAGALAVGAYVGVKILNHLP